MGSPRRSQHYCEAEAAIDAAGVRLYVASWLGMHTQHMTHDTAPAISKYINNAVPGGDCARGRHCTVSAAASRRHVWMPLWICLQEKAHVPGEIDQRRELSARAAFFLWRLVNYFLWMAGYKIHFLSSLIPISTWESIN